jgi:hypothetical protein
MKNAYNILFWNPEGKHSGDVREDGRVIMDLIKE